MTKSLPDLPAELMYRIFDYCDIHTILLSLRCVCRKLNAISSGYDRFELIYDLSSKFEFRVIPRLIDAQNITSLTIFSDHSSRHALLAFESLFEIRRFNRLRSLTLDGVNHAKLNDLLQKIPNGALMSLSIRGSEWDTSAFLPNIATQFQLQKLILRDADFTGKVFPWPLNRNLTQLTIGSCTLSQYVVILHYLPCLQIFTMKNYSIDNACNETIASLSGPVCSSSLKSLTLSDYSLRFEELDLLLSLTPKLNHLKLVCNWQRLEHLRNFCYLEKIIQTKLPLLSKLEFFVSYIHDLIRTNDLTPSIKSLIVPFRRPFWLEEKQWYVTCDYLIHCRTIRLFTTPAEPDNGSRISSTWGLIEKDGSINFGFLADTTIQSSTQRNQLLHRIRHSWFNGYASHLSTFHLEYLLLNEMTYFKSSLRWEISSHDFICRLNRRPITQSADGFLEAVCADVFSVTKSS